MFESHLKSISKNSHIVLASVVTARIGKSKKVKLCLWQAVEAPTGSQIVSLTRRPPFNPRKIPGTPGVTSRKTIYLTNVKFTYYRMSAESRNCEASRQPLPGNGSANTPVAREWLISRHVNSFQSIITRQYRYHFTLYSLRYWLTDWLTD
jgi:hypothetical protein